MKKRIGIYPGTFDPITKGHLHIIQRASKLVDHLIVGISSNTRKGPLFTYEERVEMVQADINSLRGKGCSIEVKPFTNLLIDFATENEATIIFRGLRAVSDFEYEFQLTGMNAKLAPQIETVFLVASDKWQFVSSSFIKEIASLDGDVSAFVTPNTMKNLVEKFEKTA